MSRLRRSLVVLAAVVVAAALLATVPIGRTAPASALGTTTPHLVLVMLENKEYGTVVGNANAPYINDTLIPSGRLFTSYYAGLHPSLPNYLAITSGQFGGCLNDACARGTAKQDNLFAQMDRASPRISWKVYAESMPSNCYKWNSGAYAVRHNPPPYYANVSSCAANDVPLTALAPAIDGNALPRFAMLVPNIYNDMHSDQQAAPCQLGSAVQDEVCQGDSWLQSQLPAVLSDGGRNDVTVVVMFDEGTTGQGGGGRVMMLEVGPNTCTGCTDDTPFSERAMSNAVDDWFGLPHLAVDTPGF